MRRFCTFFLLTFFSCASFAFTLDDLNVVPNANIVNGTSGVVATDDVLKTLTTKKIELESIISLEKNRTFDEAKKRDDLQNTLQTLETGLNTWNQISEEINHKLSQGALNSASNEIQKLVENRDKIQKDLIALFVSVSQTLDVGPFSEENTT